VIFPSADPLEEKVGNKYSLVIVSAKRARQIKEGSLPLADITSSNPLSIALEEIAAGQVTAIAPLNLDEDLDRLPVQDAASAVALLASISSDDAEEEDVDETADTELVLPEAEAAEAEVEEEAAEEAEVEEEPAELDEEHEEE
jgi:DNA-directed RNA polymerase subunit omega